MKRILVVRADTNDADYVTQETPINDGELDLIKEVVNAIGEFKPYKTQAHGMDWKHEHNFPTGDCHRPDLNEKSAKELYGHLPGFELFVNYFLPWSEYGIHTIDSVEIRPEIETEKWL